MSTGATSTVVGKAGHRAEDRYQSLRRVWWSRVRRRILLVLAMAAMVLVAPLLFLAAHFHSGAWWFDAGVLVGGGTTIWLALSESPPAHIEQFRTGSEGEKRTARVLSTMPTGWSILHDLDAGAVGGNLDHIAVGPGGVFLLDSKWYIGATSIENGAVRVRRYEDDDLTYVAERLPQRMRALARHVHDQVRAATRVSVWVTPVVVLWGDFPAQVQEDAGVAYVHGKRLAAWLAEQPSRLPDVAVGRVVAALTAID